MTPPANSKLLDNFEVAAKEWRRTSTYNLGGNTKKLIQLRHAALALQIAVDDAVVYFSVVERLLSELHNKLANNNFGTMELIEQANNELAEMKRMIEEEDKRLTPELGQIINTIYSVVLRPITTDCAMLETTLANASGNSARSEQDIREHIQTLEDGRTQNYKTLQSHGVNKEKEITKIKESYSKQLSSLATQIIEAETSEREELAAANDDQPDSNERTRATRYAHKIRDLKKEQDILQQKRDNEVTKLIENNGKELALANGNEAAVQKQLAELRSELLSLQRRALQSLSATNILLRQPNNQLLQRQYLSQKVIPDFNLCKKYLSIIIQTPNPSPMEFVLLINRIHQVLLNSTGTLLV